VRCREFLRCAGIVLKSELGPTLCALGIQPMGSGPAGRSR